jgi:hypothetical protein
MTGYVRTTGMTAAVAAVILALLVVATTPLTLGPLGVTAWFLVALVGISSLVALVAYGLSLRFHSSLKHGQQVANSWRRGVLVGGYLTIVLALSSLKQLNIRDLILLLILLILVEFYSVARS